MVSGEDNHFASKPVREDGNGTAIIGAGIESNLADGYGHLHPVSPDRFQVRQVVRAGQQFVEHPEL